MLKALFSSAIVLLSACSAADSASTLPKPVASKTTASLVVAGGCFWCVESDFEKKTGVIEAVSGYSGGDIVDATYYNHEGHREAVEIFYDPALTSYETLVHDFLRSIDATDKGGQFCDRGYAYTTAIYYRTDAEKQIAEAALIKAGETLGKPIATALEQFNFIVTAEKNHQNYYRENPVRYKFYRSNCGRDRRVKALWGSEAAGH